MSALLAHGIPLALLAAVVVPGVLQLLRPVHPHRLLAEALSSGFLLLVVGTLLGLPWPWSPAWWAALAVAVAGAVAGTARALRAAPHPRAAAPERRGAEDVAGRARRQPPAPLPPRIRPPGTASLVLNGLLWAGILAVSLLAG